MQPDLNRKVSKSRRKVLVYQESHWKWLESKRACTKEKSKIKIAYALKNVHAPIGVASYEAEIVKALSKNLKSSLLTVEEIEAEINWSIYE